MTKRDPTQPTERRQFPRATLKTAVSLVSESNFYTGFANDISEGGLFISTHQLAARATVFQLEFTLPEDDGDDPITVSAEVRWVREDNPTSDAPPGMGLQFLDLNEEDRLRIMKFLSQRETIFYED